MQLPQTWRIVQDSYAKEDTLHLKYYLFDHWKRTPVRRRAPDTIPVNDEVNLSMLIESLYKLPLNIVWDDAIEKVQAKDSYRERWTSQFMAEAVVQNLEFEDSITYILPVVEYTALWQNETDGAAAKYVMVETGRVEYAFFRTFAVAVVRDNQILYYSNHYHRDTLFLNQGEEPEHEFPQPMLDTLVTLAMKHYLEKLE